MIGKTAGFKEFCLVILNNAGVHFVYFKSGDNCGAVRGVMYWGTTEDKSLEVDAAVHLPLGRSGPQH